MANSKRPRNHRVGSKYVSTPHSTRRISAASPNARGKKDVPLLQEIASVGIRDRYSYYPSYGLTPERLAGIFRAADAGDVFSQSELFEEMLERDMKLAGMFASRRTGVTKCNYDILIDSEDMVDLKKVDEVQAMINRIENFDSAKGDILDAVPKYFSAVEIFWSYRNGKYEIERLERRHQKQFRYGTADGLGDPNDLRFVVSPEKIEIFRGLVTPEDLAHASVDGISLRKYPAIRKRFIISASKSRSSDPARGALLRTCGFGWLFKNFDVKWWVEFAEQLLGLRIGKYDPNQPDQMNILFQALESLRTDSAAVISKESAIEFLQMQQMAQAHKAYGDLADWIDNQYAVVILGHEGSSQSTPGKMGNEVGAIEAKQELVAGDAKNVLDEPITNDLIKVYFDFNYGPQELYPYHQTDTSRVPDLTKEVEIDQGIQRMGFPITKEYIAEKYGRPLPGPRDEILKPVVGGPSVLPSDPSAIAAKKKLIGKR